MRTKSSKTELQLLERAQRLNGMLFSILAMALMYLGDAHGYSDSSSVKLFSGEVWPALEGSGHSVSSVAIIYGFLSALTALNIIEQPFSPKAKAAIALVVSGALEVAGPIMNSTVSEKDLLVMFPITALLFLLEKLIENGERKLISQIPSEE